MTEAPFHTEMQCFVESVAYDFVRHLGTVRIMDHGCTDMGGCIAFFLLVDPNVRHIETFSSGEKDTVYIRDSHGQWSAV